MRMQDYDMIISRLEGLARRAETFNTSKEDLTMRLWFMADDLRLEQKLEEEKMLEGLVTS
jgi:hypothetical protein